MKREPEIIEGALAIFFQKTIEGLKFLLLEHKDGFWTFVGGIREEQDASTLDCIKREIKEEIGLEEGEYGLSNTGIKNEFVYGSEKSDRVGKKGITYVFVSEIKKELKFKSFHNIEKYDWFSEEEVLGKIQFKDIKDLFSRTLEFIKGFETEKTRG